MLWGTELISKLNMTSSIGAKLSLTCSTLLGSYGLPAYKLVVCQTALSVSSLFGNGRSRLPMVKTVAALGFTVVFDAGMQHGGSSLSHGHAGRGAHPHASFTPLHSQPTMRQQKPGTPDFLQPARSMSPWSLQVGTADSALQWSTYSLTWSH